MNDNLENGVKIMAKRKRKKQAKKEFEVDVQIYGVLLILAAVLGLGKYGPVGRAITSFSLFLVGSLYIPLLVVFLIIGGYVLIKKSWPEFFTQKMVGIYLFTIGILILMHEKFVQLNVSNMMAILKDTINQLMLAMRELMQLGQVSDWLGVGGGILGGLFSSLFAKLFSYTGMQIVSWVLMIIGICLFTSFSIIDFIKDNVSKISKREPKEDNNETQTPDDAKLPFDDKKPIIHNSNEQVKITTIDELKKKTVEEPHQEEQEPKEKNQISSDYRLPTLDILTKPKTVDNSSDNAQVDDNVKALEKVLKDFGIIAKVVEVHIGPAVSQYELEVASGTRVNKIISINREIALALAKKDVRIEAPIPGKKTVGIEFANEKSNSVSFYEIMASREIQSSTNKLLVPLGKTIMGEIQTCPINKMPHLLIAGTTGSGKSVCVNGIICSILMRARPDEVKLILVDPKVVELSVYNGIPHLICPVVTDAKQANIALQKSVAEMEKRYQMFSNTTTKNIEGYNEYVEKYNKGKADSEKLDKMPYLVIIIDELSDLMMVAAKEVEDSILRITQKARAAGIHLIVATQRPSTEVITGLIKANIPSRISFAVGSGIDSRTILDQIGAEKLLGKGDMLYLPIGQNNPTRTQGSFVSDQEIQKLIDFTSKQQEGNLFDEEFLNLDASPKDSSKGASSQDDDTPVDNAGDDLYDQIVEFVIRKQQASVSLIQRKFKIGFNKAATMIDQLEENGIIGPPTGNSKPRTVLVSFAEDPEETSQIQDNIGEE